MRSFVTLTAVAAVTLGACDAGITEPTSANVVALTPDYTAETGCALFADGTLRCRGWNQYGQLGTGTRTDTDPWVDQNDARVDSPVRFRSVALGGGHACALDSEGATWCWGLNRWGQLGVGDTAGPEICPFEYGWPVVQTTIGCASRPVRVPNAPHFLSLAAQNNETCGLTSGGELWCWGEVDDGFGLGSGGSLPPSCGATCPSPVRAAPALRFKKFVTYEHASCGIATDGRLYCWGYDVYARPSRLGRDSLDPGDPLAPTPINSTDTFADVALAVDHTCAITTTGGLVCFGWNYFGQLGDGSFVGRDTPLPSTVEVPFSRVTVWQGSSCALDRAGKAWCWGRNAGGGLGTGIYSDTPEPHRVLGDLTFSSLRAGEEICGTARDGIWCWGPLPSRFEQ